MKLDLMEQGTLETSKWQFIRGSPNPNGKISTLETLSVEGEKYISSEQVGMSGVGRLWFTALTSAHPASNDVNLQWYELHKIKLPESELLKVETIRPEDTLSKGISKIDAFESEHRAFLGLLDSLLKNEGYRGRFVAVYKGGVVDADTNIRELAKKVYKKHGYVPIYMGKVKEKEEIVELPSPER